MKLLLKTEAVGIDEVTKEKYSEALDSNIEDLVLRLKNKAYNVTVRSRVRESRTHGSVRG